MSSKLIIFIITTITTVYLLFGLFTWLLWLEETVEYTFEEFTNSSRYNPLLKPVFIMLWPLVIIGLIMIFIVGELKEYCDEVLDYYKNKKGNKKK